MFKYPHFLYCFKDFSTNLFPDPRWPVQCFSARLQQKHKALFIIINQIQRDFIYPQGAIKIQQSSKNYTANTAWKTS